MTISNALPMKTSKVLTRMVAIVAVLCAGLLGAGQAQAAPETSAGANGMATAWIRAAHLVPDLGPVSITLVPFAGAASGEVTKPGVPPADTMDGARVVEPSSAYGSAGEYRQVPQGLYTVQVRPSGAAMQSSPMLTGTLDAKADQAYTLAALGRKDSPRIQVLADDLRPPKAGSASVRLLSAASQTPSVTVTAEGGQTIAKDAAFGKPTGYASVPAGTWDLSVNPTGGASSTGVAASVSLTSGSVYTLLVIDGAEGRVKVKPLLDAASMASIPSKGVQTGAGGTAPDSPGLALGVLGAGLVLVTGLALLAGLGLRRRIAMQSTVR